MQGTLFNQFIQGRPPVSLTDEERRYAVAVAVSSSPAYRDVWAMLNRYMPSELYGAMSSRMAPVTQTYLAACFSSDPLDTADRILERSRARSISVMTFWDADYPPLLREIQQPPVAIYLKGGLDDGPAIAIVGTRRSDSRSDGHARRIAADCAAAGLTVVSGMAVGIDREAHRGALDGGGRTVGVLANGIDIAYPAANRDLYARIESAPGSALISEYPPGVRAGTWTFVRRNRIISGLCKGTVVIKAGIKSGALITARHALEQNREVFACAGASFDEEYAGCHDLIRNGAVLVSRSEDVLGEFAGFNAAAGRNGARRDDAAADEGAGVSAGTNDPDPSSIEGRILRLISSRGQDVDSIIRQGAGTAPEVNEALTGLELDGRITRNGTMILRV